MGNPATASNGHHHLGFSLIQLSLLMMAAGLIMVAMLPGGEVGSYYSRMQVSHERMMKIEQATEGFMAANGRRPCPADATVDVGAAAFGREAATPGTCTGGTPAANFDGTGANANVTGGGVPNVALGLPDEYAFDGFGNRITYVVDRRATAKSSCLTLQGGSSPKPGYAGDIELRDSSGGTLLANSMWLLLSHGQDAHGAFPMQGQGAAGGGALTSRINTGNTGVDTQKNAAVDASFATAFSKTFVKKEPTTANPVFDDFAWISEKTKNTCCLGKVCRNSAVKFNGLWASSWAGHSAALGDINGDGIKDIIFNNGSEIFVIYGKRGGWADTEIPLNYGPGSIIDGVQGQFFSTGIWSIGDIASGDMNGDGIDDIVVSMSRGLNVYGAGTVYVIYGKQGGWGSGAWWIGVDDAFLTAGGGFRLDGATTGEQMGHQLALGDVNGDGKLDFILSQIANSDWVGNLLYVVYGKSSWPAATTIDDAYLDGGGTALNGFKLWGWAIMNSDNPRVNLASGDINGDGFDDIVSASFRASTNGLSENGALYVVYGKPTAGRSAANIAVDETFLAGGGTAVNGFRLDGAINNRQEFKSVSVADINGDGFDDIFVSGVGEPSISNGNSAVVYGKAGGFATTQTLDSSFVNSGGTAAKGFFLFYGWNVTPVNTGLGDFNGDGIMDMVASQAGNAYDGQLFVRFGITTPWDWFNYNDDGTLNGGLVGTRITGDGGNFIGNSTIMIGDVTGDGRGDLVFSSMYEGANDEGALRVIYGRKSPFPPTNFNDLLSE